ncbi:pilus assembly PilX family protein [Cupriavidus sp. D39]|uniref:pilus assembly PilX family protein n=1 Tax=Cupriavidus sp. D39 TaxID=2997877 RepID=UPI00226D6508|nr:PilX N-terminal domain-containing pilus assembly protein [Cupriavidus sp. D39]MCY0856153.1 PilX N-terminal domain-containing pilus assembly protein [Cupriavidus sp. D39]
MTLQATKRWNRMTQLPAARQAGVSLVVVLLFLVILTLVGVSSSLLSTSGERMARNSRDQNIALQAAEAALRDARIDITTTRGIAGATGATATCDYTGFKGFCTPATAGQPVWNLYIEDDNRSVTLGAITKTQGVNPVAGVAKQPHYLIEPIPDSSPGSMKAGPINYVYRISAIGYGANANTKVLIQEIFRP